VRDGSPRLALVAVDDEIVMDDDPAVIGAVVVGKIDVGPPDRGRILRGVVSVVAPTRLYLGINRQPPPQDLGGWTRGPGAQSRARLPARAGAPVPGGVGRRRRGLPLPAITRLCPLGNRHPWGRVTLEAWPDTIHAWHLFYQQAGRPALAAVGAFIRGMLGGGQGVRLRSGGSALGPPGPPCVDGRTHPIAGAQPQLEPSDARAPAPASVP
jgi:hypothetical protein